LLLLSPVPPLSQVGLSLGLSCCLPQTVTLIPIHNFTGNQLCHRLINTWDLSVTLLTRVTFKFNKLYSTWRLAGSDNERHPFQEKWLSDAKSERFMSVKPQSLEGGDITSLIAPVVVRLF